MENTILADLIKKNRRNRMIKTILADLIKKGYDFLNNKNSLCNLRWRLIPSKELTQTVVTMTGTLSVFKDMFLLRCLENLQEGMKYPTVEFDQSSRNFIASFDVYPTSIQNDIMIECSESLWEDGGYDSIRARFKPAEFESCIAFLLEYIFKFDAEEKSDYLVNTRKRKKVLVPKTLTTSGVALKTGMVEGQIMGNFISLCKTLDFDALAKEFIKKYCPS